MIGIHIGAGLCNRIFQMIFAYATAKKFGTSFRFENWESPSHHSQNVYTWLVERFMKLPNYIHSSVNYAYKYTEPGNKFTECLDMGKEIPDLVEKEVLIAGFFQNENYFKEYRSEVLELLREPEYITEKINTTYADTIKYFENAWFMHIRLGDYIHHYKHWIHLETYYIQAIKLIQEKHQVPTLILFSNEPYRIRNVYPNLMKYLDENVIYMIVLDTDEVLNLYMMVRCKNGGICANSTYGWWANWLNTNPQKMNIMPSKWMLDTENIQIYPEGSIILPVD